MLPYLVVKDNVFHENFNEHGTLLIQKSVIASSEIYARSSSNLAGDGQPAVPVAL
jgi:hypothetical protein